MSKIIMMQGLPASGKSTRAKEIVTQGNFVRVNRDLLRTMLHFDKWTGRNEDMTVHAEKAVVKKALEQGLSVVIDDCNLNPKNKEMWSAFAEENNAKFESEMINTPIAECIRRDKEREKSVGSPVISNMGLQWNLFPVPTKGFIVCDLDGTLANIEHRLQYAKGETKDWEKFFVGIPEDKLNWSTAETVDDYIGRGHKVIFVSARPERCRKDTQEWLEKWGYHMGENYETLIMRKDRDKRDDVEVKQEIFNIYFKDKYPIEVVIDDRPKVIRMWRANGLEVIDVGQGIEF